MNEKEKALTFLKAALFSHRMMLKGKKFFKENP